MRQYKFIGVGTDSQGLLHWFGKGEERKAEAWAHDASLKAGGLPLDLKEIEITEEQLLAILNQHLLLQRMLKAQQDGRKLN